jgi:predicted PurR-regulated permease PerM
MGGEGRPGRPTGLMKVGFDPFNSAIFVRIAALLWAMVIALAIAFCFFASSFCITLLLATYLSILVDPIVSFLERWRIPRAASAGLLIVAGMLAIGFLGYSSYNRFSTFIERLPMYTERIRSMTEPLSRQITKVEESAGKLNPDSSKRITEVKVKQPAAWPSYLVRGFGSASNVIVIAGVVPFLLFFLLIRKEKWYDTLVDILGAMNDPQEFSNRLTQMVRRFAIGNLVVGMLMATITAGVLFMLNIQGAVILGVVSGFLNVIPFLGVILASAIPIAAALLQSSPASVMFIIALVVVSLHIVTSNFLFPRFVGSRMNIGPVAATAGILFWGWLWGIVGVLLAIPLTGTVKLIADCHPSLSHLSNMLGESSEKARRQSADLEEVDLSRTAPVDISK